MPTRRTPRPVAGSEPKTAEEIAKAVSESSPAEPSITTFSEDTETAPRTSDVEASSSMGILNLVTDWIRLNPALAGLGILVLYFVAKNLRR